jgi:Tfp pilus assembly protein PilX
LHEQATGLGEINKMIDRSVKASRQSGAVSLFIVLFATLLITIVTVSFVQLMIKDQQQATASDLSQSAYDSAQAGVEDAKRLLVLDQACKNNTAASTINCAAIASALTPTPGQSDTECDTLAKAGLVSETNGEVIVQQNDSVDSKLDQAYTCVKVGVNTDDYKGELNVNQSLLVPVTGVGTFDSIELSWFSRQDVSSTTNDPTVGFPTSNSTTPLPPVGNKWKFNYPPLLRTQLIQTGASFKLSDFDDNADGNKSDANTLFLYPISGTSNGPVDSKDFALDARQSPTLGPQQVSCKPNFTDSEYVCSAVLKLPNPMDGNVANRNGYLRLTSLYNGVHFSVRLKNGSEYVKFNGVQPQVDSTGRANDMFRRVSARIELRGDFTYPEAAIDMNGNLCKNFTVTDAEDGFQGSTSCTP